jgi:hypothetical protein
LPICKDPYRTAGGPRLPSSEKSNRAFALTSSSRSRPIAVNTGAVWLELTAGLALCAATQIEQEADSVRVGWLWVDSAATVHNIKDRPSQADHRTHKRINYPGRLSCFGIRRLQSYNGYPTRGNDLQVTIGTGAILAAGQSPPNALILKREGSMSEPTYEELKAKLSQLEKEVETKKRSGDLIFKVGEKGGVSVYGLGRFPVTLYYEQWNRLLGAADEIKKFMEESKSKLKLKEQG